MKAILSGSVVQAPLFMFGDSVAGFGPVTLFNALQNAIGVAGYAGTAVGDGTTSLGGVSRDSTTGTITEENGTTVPYNPLNWPTGTTFGTLSTGATATYGTSGSPFNGTYFAAYLKKGVGQGVALVELVDNAGTVQSTVGTFNLSAASDSLQIASITLGAAAARRIKVTASSGSVTVCALQFKNTLIPGVVLCGMSRGGLPLSDSTQTNASMVSAFYADCAPVLSTYHMREGGGATINAANGLTQMLANLEGAYSGSDWVFIGPTAGSQDAGVQVASSVSYDESLAVRAIAINRGNVFIDTIQLLGSYAQIMARDAGFDGNHVNVTERAKIGSAIINEIGLLSLDGLPITQPVRNAKTRSARVAVSKNGTESAEPLWIESDNYNIDGYLRTDRWLSVTDKAGNVGVFVSPGWGGGSGVILGYGNPGFVGDVSRYSANGQYSISVHPTTGVATLYSKVNGVLKSLSLGTLS